MADDLLIKTVQHILSQQYDRNDIKTLCKIQFLLYIMGHRVHEQTDGQTELLDYLTSTNVHYIHLGGDENLENH